jgi:F0F1-type ATP synthase assembly protein I
MKKTKAPKSTLSPNGGSTETVTAVTRNRSQQATFMMAVLNMSWQLAIVVLVPIIGGYKLDILFGSLPVFTIVGFLIAMVGSGIVMWRQLQLFGPAPKPHIKGHRT